MNFSNCFSSQLRMHLIHEYIFAVKFSDKMGGGCITHDETLIHKNTVFLNEIHFQIVMFYYIINEITLSKIK